jgi:hypothetical protein
VEDKFVMSLMFEAKDKVGSAWARCSLVVLALGDDRAKRVSPSFLETRDFSAKTSPKYTDFLTSVTDCITILSELLGGGAPV